MHLMPQIQKHTLDFTNSAFCFGQIIILIIMPHKNQHIYI
jgi:hypothetical protein